MMPIKRLSLTDLKSAIPRGAREKTLKTALDKDGVMGKWEETAWAKKVKAKKTRSEMTDLDPCGIVPAAVAALWTPAPRARPQKVLG